ncbi:MAG: hypothetical protein K0S11_1355, partial [Gammaproteobacteria bacterium]|nr:hypothetical protein [Gammaproteobacteria bacterium]
NNNKLALSNVLKSLTSSLIFYKKIKHPIVSSQFKVLSDIYKKQKNHELAIITYSYHRYGVCKPSEIFDTALVKFYLSAGRKNEVRNKITTLTIESKKKKKYLNLINKYPEKIKFASNDELPQDKQFVNLNYNKDEIGKIFNISFSDKEDIEDQDSDCDEIPDKSYIDFESQEEVTSYDIATSTQTLGDGNCAFNACALGLCGLVEHGRLPLEAIGTQLLFQMLSAKLNLSSHNREAFLEWLNKHKNLNRRQTAIAPILRHFTISFISAYYEELDFASRYKEAFIHAYNLYQAGMSNDDDTFIVHPYIEAKFKEHVLTDESLLNWWDAEGHTQYFNTLRQPADDALDKKRWGSEIELNALAFSLGINIIYRKANSTPQYLGIGSGWLPNLSQQEIEQLRNLEVGEPFLQGFRLYASLTLDELIQRATPLPASISASILNLAKQASENGHRNFPSTIIDVENMSAVCQQLENRHIIQKQSETYLFVGEDNQIDMAAIDARMQGISEELRQKLIDYYQSQVAAFQLIHVGAHWSYQANPSTSPSISPVRNNQSKSQVTGQLTPNLRTINSQAPDSYQYFKAMESELTRLNSLVLPESLGGTNEIIQYLNDCIKQDDVVINTVEWDMHPGTSQTGGTQLESYDFPFDSFRDNFLQHQKKQKFVLPLLLMQAHFAGLVIIKHAHKWLVKYINPTGSNPPQKGEDKEALAKIKQALQKITDEHQITFEDIEILSNNQQLNEFDCAFIVAQTLVETALEQDISIKPYIGDMTAYVKPITHARAHFYSQDRLGDNYESAIRDQLYSRLAKALTTNQSYVQELESFLRQKDINEYPLDDRIVKELNILLTQIESNTIANQPGTMLVDKATSFLTTSANLKSIGLAEIKEFCEKLLEPYFTEVGSLIFKLNHNLQNHTKSSENFLEDISLAKQTNSSYGKLFQPILTDSAKILKKRGMTSFASELDELAEMEEILVNQAIQESKSRVCH